MAYKRETGEVKTVKPVKAESTKRTKTNHKPSWHKRTKNPTFNYPKDGHNDFCVRCNIINHGCTGNYKACSL